MTVAELREWLATQDQEAIVQVLTTDGECSSWEEFDPVNYSTYFDFRNNRFVEESDPKKNVRFLELGRQL
jgi:hypothetical protein